MAARRGGRLADAYGTPLAPPPCVSATPAPHRGAGVASRTGIGGLWPPRQGGGPVRPGAADEAPGNRLSYKPPLPREGEVSAKLTEGCSAPAGAGPRRTGRERKPTGNKTKGCALAQPFIDIPCHPRGSQPVGYGYRHGVYIYSRIGTVPTCTIPQVCRNVNRKCTRVQTFAMGRGPRLRRLGSF